jgi:hypothetical protein
MECFHESCTCQVTVHSSFCSTACETGSSEGPYCLCGHAECETSPPTMPLA